MSLTIIAARCPVFNDNFLFVGHSTVAECSAPDISRVNVGRTCSDGAKRGMAEDFSKHDAATGVCAGVCLS